MAIGPCSRALVIVKSGIGPGRPSLLVPCGLGKAGSAWLSGRLTNCVEQGGVQFGQEVVVESDRAAAASVECPIQHGVSRLVPPVFLSFREDIRNTIQKSSIYIY